MVFPQPGIEVWFYNNYYSVSECYHKGGREEQQNQTFVCQIIKTQ